MSLPCSFEERRPEFRVSCSRFLQIRITAKQCSNAPFIVEFRYVRSNPFTDGVNGLLSAERLKSSPYRVFFSQQLLSPSRRHTLTFRSGNGQICGFFHSAANLKLQP
jgi:hypothetical protein